MYCDGCGSPFVAGAQYCRSCGKRILGAPPVPPVGAAASQPPAASAARGVPDGRVGRNISLLAAFWLANGILRLLGVGSWLIFRRFLFDGGWWHPGWPFHFGPFFMGGLFFGGGALAFFGILHLLLAWGLYERQSWARPLAIVIGVLALIRFPFGTALGIYTLWVMLPEGSAREYDAMARVGGQVTPARYSA